MPPFSGVALTAGIWVNPPYAFAPEDNLTYRDMIVLHQQAIAILEARYPEATVLTAWPASAEIEHPELGFTSKPFKTDRLENFSYAEMQRAAEDPGGYDTAPCSSRPSGHRPRTPSASAAATSPCSQNTSTFISTCARSEAAAMLHGEVVWQASRGGEWAALLRFPRIVDALSRASADRRYKRSLA